MALDSQLSAFGSLSIPSSSGHICQGSKSIAERQETRVKSQETRAFQSVVYRSTSIKWLSTLSYSLSALFSSRHIYQLALDSQLSAFGSLFIDAHLSIGSRLSAIRFLLSFNPLFIGAHLSRQQVESQEPRVKSQESRDKRQEGLCPLFIEAHLSFGSRLSAIRFLLSFNPLSTARRGSPDPTDEQHLSRQQVDS